LILKYFSHSVLYQICPVMMAILDLQSTHNGKFSKWSSNDWSCTVWLQSSL